MADTSENLWEAVKSGKGRDPGAVRVLADFLLERGDKGGEQLVFACSKSEQLGSIVVCALGAKHELEKVSAEEFRKLALESRRKQYKWMDGRTDLGSKDEMVEKQTQYEVDRLENVFKYLQLIAEAPTPQGAQSHVTIARGGLKSMMRPPESVNLDWCYTFENDSRAASALEWLELARENARKKKGTPKEKTIQRRLVDILRKRYGDGQFTGRQASEAHYEAQLEAGKTPAGAAAKHKRASLYYHTEPLLRRMAEALKHPTLHPYYYSGGAKALWKLRPDAETLVDDAQSLRRRLEQQRQGNLPLASQVTP